MIPAIAPRLKVRLVPGGGVFDVVIAQVALKAEVDQLLTFNPQDFIQLGDAIAQLVQVPE